MLLNINIPLNPKGIKETVQGLSPFNERYELKDGLYYLVGEALASTTPQDSNTDVRSYYDGYVSITPLTIDRTCRN